MRDAAGNFLAIVEEKDATPDERAITEVNMSTYVFQCGDLLWALDQLTANNAQGEYYLTDCPGVLKQAGKQVVAANVLQPCEALSINTPAELASGRSRNEKAEALDRAAYLGIPASRILHPSTMNDLKLFSGTANPALAKRIAEYLGVPLGEIALGNFPDGEISCKINEDVRGRDVFLIQPTCPPVNENLMQLLIMIDSCMRASAERITAVIPYFGYARQDRKDEGRVPITAKLVANIITRAGADRVLTMDLHAAQIQGFFDVPVDHLYAAPVLNEYFLNSGIDLANVVIVSPDEGSIKRALGHAKRLGGTLAIVDKRRTSADTTVQANILGGEVKGKVALMFDDMISTAGSITGAAKVLHEHGVKEIHVAATHAVLVGPAMERLKAAISPAWSAPTRFRCGRPNPAADAGTHRRPALGRSHQADPSQRIGQPAVPLEHISD